MPIHEAGLLPQFVAVDGQYSTRSHAPWHCLPETVTCPKSGHEASVPLHPVGAAVVQLFVPGICCCAVAKYMFPAAFTPDAADTATYDPFGELVNGVPI